MNRHNFESYKDRYETISLERTDDGILTVTLHAPNDPESPVDYCAPYDWHYAHVEWSYCFFDIARDYHNEVVILTHTGPDFIKEEQIVDIGVSVPVSAWDKTQSHGYWLQMGLLGIECPVIGVVKGAAWVHAELLTQSDIVLCSEDASFGDVAHFEGGFLAPGDGVQIAWPSVLGPTRGSYFLMTGQVLDAQQALNLGVVNEVLPVDQLLPRAHRLAEEILRRPKLVRRYARIMGTHAARIKMTEQLGFGLALEGLSSAAPREMEQRAK